MGKGKSIVFSNGDGGNSTDCSRVRILLCDTNDESSRHVSDLLTQCSYQVALVSSATQMLDALIYEDHCVDIILAEIAILIANGSDILNYIKRNVRLKHIPVIMMVKNEEVSLIRKGLGFGAADYLVKPLSIHEIKNLGIHIMKHLCTQTQSIQLM